METLEQKLNRKSNDYSSLALFFEKNTGKDIIFGKPKYSTSLKASVIIPCYQLADRLYKCLESINQQTAIKNDPEKFEIVIVDDGSTEPVVDCAKYVKFLCKKTVIRNSKKLGRSTARNIGTAHSENEIIFYIDSDIVLEPDYLDQHLKRHQIFNNLILVSFKENLDVDSPLISDSVIKQTPYLLRPKHTNDFRYFKDLSTFIGADKDRKNGIVRIFEETDAFKKFGNGKFVGTWDLPTMVVSNNMSVRKEIACKVGGFDERFKGWGLEDTHFGAKIICQNQFLIPILSVNCYHIKHPPRDGSLENKTVEMMRNWNLYRQLLKEESLTISPTDFIKKYKSIEVEKWVSKD